MFAKLKGQRPTLIWKHTMLLSVFSDLSPHCASCNTNTPPDLILEFPSLLPSVPLTCSSAENPECCTHTVVCFWDSLMLLSLPGMPFPYSFLLRKILISLNSAREPLLIPTTSLCFTALSTTVNRQLVAFSSCPICL